MEDKRSDLHTVIHCANSCTLCNCTCICFGHYNNVICSLTDTCDGLKAGIVVDQFAVMKEDTPINAGLK